MKASIIDYGTGNLFNLKRGLEEVGFETEIVTEAEALNGAELIILPGVGNFAKATEKLNNGLGNAIKKAWNDGAKIVGICLGMQLLFQSSEEAPGVEGLGLIPGTIKKLPNTITVPQMGWNGMSFKEGEGIFKGLEQFDSTYFVHSYHADGVPEEFLAAWVDCGDVRITAAVRRDRILGFQFHPERSGVIGMRIMKNLKTILTFDGHGGK